jgi:uncharacterized protein (TIGR02271 family)
MSRGAAGHPGPGRSPRREAASTARERPKTGRVAYAPIDEVLEWRGQTMLGSRGDKLGKIEEIYLDDRTEQPEWALVQTGMFGSASSFVPLANARTTNGDVEVPFEKAQVKDAPKLDPDGQLSEQEEAQLYRHYGMSYDDTRADAGSDREGRDVSGPETDEAMTRSEEELAVGTTRRETGRVRLRKYIVEEEVTQTVPVRREEVRVEREPITDSNIGEATSGAELSEEDHEVVLHEEQAISEKRVVPKERVRLDTDVEHSEETVSETVRKEQVDVLGADGEPHEGHDGVAERSAR